jgi:hypothetical protein
MHDLQPADPDQHSCLGSLFAASDASFPFKAFSGRLICRQRFRTPSVHHFTGTQGTSRL